MCSGTQASLHAQFVEAARSHEPFELEEKIPSHPHIELHAGMRFVGSNLILSLYTFYTSPPKPNLHNSGKIFNRSLYKMTAEERVWWARKVLLILHRIQESVAAIYDIIETADPEADIEEVAMLMFQS